MAEKAFILRLKTENGQKVVKDLTGESTVHEFKQAVSKVTKIPTTALKIRKGFPPTLVDLSHDQSTLLALQFRSGDSLIVEEDSAARRQKEQEQSEAVLQAYESQIEAGGFLTRQIVPANNSCLFTSINYVMKERGELDLDSAAPMREIIAGVVQSDPETYNEGYLGRTNEAYCEWIMNAASWGGGIEVAILSAFYKIEIAVIDTQNVMISRFGEDQNYTERVLLIYDGIHYDPLEFEPVDPADRKRTKFSASNEQILTQALELAAEAKSSRQFTDVVKFTIKCLICQKTFQGQTEAQAHAKTTGHINFGEV